MSFGLNEIVPFKVNNQKSSSFIILPFRKYTRTINNHRPNFRIRTNIKSGRYYLSGGKQLSYDVFYTLKGFGDFGDKVVSALVCPQSLWDKTCI